MKRLGFIYLLFAFFNINIAISQSISDITFDDMLLRDMYLRGLVDNGINLFFRPNYLKIEDSTLEKSKLFFTNNQLIFPIKNGKKLYLLNQSSYLNYNSSTPWGRNDGYMKMFKGFQQTLNSSFGIDSKYFGLQISPGYILAKSKKIDEFNYVNGTSYLRIGNPKYLSLIAGINNYWSGPGVFNSIILSNNAPPIRHIVLSNLQPWKLRVGAINFAILGGLLENKIGTQLQNFNQIAFENIFFDRLKYKRYINGLFISYEPVFLKGINFGFTRLFQVYTFDLNKNSNLFSKYLPVLSNLFKNSTPNYIDIDSKNQDQMISIFFHLISKSYGFEIYGNYAWNDHLYNIRDFISNPDHSRAYTIGFRKIFESNESFYTLEVENTDLSPTNSNIARNTTNWYLHSKIKEGYTHWGQIVGGGIGPGDICSSIRFSRTSRTSKMSVMFEIIQNNPKFTDLKWNDYVIGYRHHFRTNSLSFTAGLDCLYRKNYKYFVDNVLNFNPSLKINYILK